MGINLTLQNSSPQISMGVKRGESMVINLTRQNGSPQIAMSVTRERGKR